MSQISTNFPSSSSVRDRRSQSGLTLIELMIAMTIGLILLVALGQLFVTTRSTHKIEEGYARVQEAGRFSMEFLRKDIRMAGYAGCSSPTGTGDVTGNGAGTACTTNFCNLASPADESNRFAANGVRGYTYTGDGTSNNLTDWTPNLPSAFFANGEVRPNTGVILIQYSSSTGVYVSTAGPPDAQITVNDPTKFQQNEILVISDCQNTDIFRVTNTPASAGNIAHGANAGGANYGNYNSFLTHTYGPGAEILKLTSMVYYIGTNAAGEPALMRKNLQDDGTVSAAAELVEDVEDMRFLYGVDTDPPPTPPNIPIANRYVLANDVVDLTGLGTTTWDNAVSVRMGFLIRTPDKVDQSTDTKTYEIVDGVNVGPFNDHRRRQVYRTTVEIRN